MVSYIYLILSSSMDLGASGRLSRAFRGCQNLLSDPLSWLMPLLMVICGVCYDSDVISAVPLEWGRATCKRCLGSVWAEWGSEGHGYQTPRLGT